MTEAFDLINWHMSRDMDWLMNQDLYSRDNNEELNGGMEGLSVEGE